MRHMESSSHPKIFSLYLYLSKMMACFVRMICLVSAAARAYDTSHTARGNVHRIVNGDEAQRGKFPWIVALEGKVSNLLLSETNNLPLCRSLAIAMSSMRVSAWLCVPVCICND